MTRVEVRGELVEVDSLFLLYGYWDQSQVVTRHSIQYINLFIHLIALRKIFLIKIISFEYNQSACCGRNIIVLVLGLASAKGMCEPKSECDSKSE